MKGLLMGLFSLLQAFSMISCAKTQELTADSRVLVIGDSISLGFQPFIPNSFHNPGNAQATTYAVANMYEWVGNKKYSAIVFNNGNWDTMWFDVNTTTTPELFESNLRRMAAYMKVHADKVVFANIVGPNPSTQVPLIADKAAYMARQVAYNAISLKVMQDAGIPVINLRAYTDTLTSASFIDELHYDQSSYQNMANMIISGGGL